MHQMCLETCFASSLSVHGRPCPRLLRWPVREHLERIAEAVESLSTSSAPTHRKPVHVDGGGGSHDNSLCPGAPAIATAPTIVSRRFSDTLHQLSADQSQTCACRWRRWRPRRLSLNRCYEVRSSCQVRTSWSTVLRSPDVDAATAHCLHRLVRSGPLPNVPRDVLRPLTLCARTSMFPTSVNTLIASPRLPRHSPPAPHRPIANPCM